MREILFRGKQINNGKWWFGSLITPKNLNKTYCIHNDIELPFYRGVIPETVGQYTGLTDKNGKKIFEGDIILTEFGQAQISFDECRGFGGYSNRRKSNGGLVFLCGCDLESGCIVGNIHDNPELLEEEE